MLDHHKFQEQCLSVFAKVRDETRKVILPIDTSNRLQGLLATQLDFYSQRCITVSHLLKSGLFWDAEIVFRSAIESALKILFVSAAPEPERSLRVLEFREHLNQVSTFRYRARASAGKTNKVKSDAIFTVLAMSQHELDEHNKRWTKKERKALEQKWAFAEMIKELENTIVAGHKLTYLSGLVHSYGVASHFLHADQFALELSADREHRSPEVKDILELLHFTEILTRMIAVLISAATCTAYALGRDIDLRECISELIPLTNTTQSLRDALYEAERHLYPESEA